MKLQTVGLQATLFAGILIVGTSLVAAQATPPVVTPKPKWDAQSHFHKRVEQFKKANAELSKDTTGTVVLVGDSITEHFNIRHKLPKILGGLPVVDQGISGDQIDKAENHTGVTQRVDLIKAAKPKVVFIHIGTNDFWGGKETVEAVIPQYRDMLHRIRKEMPGVKIVVESIMPAAKDKSYLNENYKEFNKKLPELAKEVNADFLDLWPSLVDDKGDLKAEYTDDGIHLLPPAYVAWQKILDDKTKAVLNDEKEFLKSINRDRDFKKKLENEQSHYEKIYQRIEKDVKALPADTTATIVVLGDSITQGYDGTSFLDEKVRGLKVVNEGIGGDIIFSTNPSYGLNNRINLVGEAKPEAVFILIGINDINGKTCDTNEYIARYKNLIQSILAVAPQTKIVIETIMPVDSTKFAGANPQVVERNARLKELAEVYGLTVLDTYSLMKDDKGELKPEYSSDGIHLTKEAYKVWFDAIKNHKY